MATVQLRHATEGRAYFDRRKAVGKTSNESMRSLKRRLSDIVYRHMVDDAVKHAVTGPGGHSGNVSNSSATSSHLRTSHFPDPPTNSLSPVSQQLLDIEGCHVRAFAAVPRQPAGVRSGILCGTVG